MNQRRRLLLGTTSALFLFCLFLVACSSEEQRQNPTSASSTGFDVLPEFAEYYQRLGGQQLLGQPISAACQAEEGRLVQYFERLRLETSSIGETAVQPYPLGEWALGGITRRVPAPVAESDLRRSFPTTGYTVQDEFLAFYEAHGGEELLGPPISPQLDEGELRVQYFRNGRLEWHPDAPRDQRVRLGPLGQAHFAQLDLSGLNCDGRFRPLDVQAGMQVDVVASVAAPILNQGEEQQLYVTVTSVAGRPVVDVPVQALVSYRADTYTIDLGVTDQQGQVQGSLDNLRFEPEEEIVVRVVAQDRSGGALGRTALSFQTWW